MHRHYVSNHACCQAVTTEPEGCQMVPNASETPTMTVEEAGALLGLSRGSAYEACRRGDIPAFRIGSRWIIPTASIRAMLDLDAGDRS